jgi:hypothetical protein
VIEKKNRIRDLGWKNGFATLKFFFLKLWGSAIMYPKNQSVGCVSLLFPQTIIQYYLHELLSVEGEEVDLDEDGAG